MQPRSYQQVFGLTDELLNRHGIQRFKSSVPSTLDQIRDVVQLLTPVGIDRELIRIGSPTDGGYLVPDDLEGIEACFSPGTANTKDFEDELAQRFSIKSYMCDYSSDIERFKTPLIPGLQFFEKKWLDIGGEEDTIDINEWVSENSSSENDLMLQMDIEGAEWRNLLNATDVTLKRFRIVVLEIHGLDLLRDRGFLDGVFRPVIERLAKYFVCVHAHPNNCCGNYAFSEDCIVPRVLELTYLRKDRYAKGNGKLRLPHPCDEINVDGKPPLQLLGILRGNAAGELLTESEWKISVLEARVATLERRLEPLQRDMDRIRRVLRPAHRALKFLRRE